MPAMPRIRPATIVRATLFALLATVSTEALAQAGPRLSTVVAFSGSQATANAVLGPDGALYGTTSASSIVTGGLVYRAAADGSGVRTIYQLKPTDGLNPVAGLLFVAEDNRLYGSTTLGSASQFGSTGTIFRLAPDGTDFSVIHRFEPFSSVNVLGAPINDDGATPEAELIVGPGGLLYGVTRDGGDNGTGVVFKLARDGSGFAVLHHFGPVTSAAGVTPPTNGDGIDPSGALVVGSDGKLYGTASSGGPNGNGTLFRLAPDGSDFEVVHEFSALTTNPNGLATNEDGAGPVAGLTDGGNAVLYGVATLGGAGGNGTVFSYSYVAPCVEPDCFQPVHSFDGSRGARPTGELLLASDGWLYGSTATGGLNAQGGPTTFGTLFRLRPQVDPAFASLISFQGSDGSSPTGRMMQLGDSTFTGLAAGGGQCGQGVIYNFSLVGNEVRGVTNCGQRDSGGGSAGPLLLLLLLAALLLRPRFAR